MSRGLMLVGMAVGLLLTAPHYSAAVSVMDVCTVVECEDGGVLCSPGETGTETQEGSGGSGITRCTTRIVDSPCSEVPACGRRVPVMGFAGLSVLGLAMVGAGTLFLRRRYHRLES